MAACALALVAVAAAPLRAQTGSMTGRIVADSTGRPIAGAQVALPDITRSTLTDAEGRFAFGRLAAGEYRVRVQHLGHQPYARVVVVRTGEATTVTIRLVETVRQLAEVRADVRAEEREAFAARPDAGVTAITARAAESVPRVGEADIVRVVQLLPGVEARNDFATGFNVRGGEGDQNLILIDGYPIYNPFHVGGLFSTFMDATVRDATLHAGAVPAAFGGRLSSVLDVRSAEDERSGLHGRTDLSVLAATAQLGGGMRDGRGVWSVAARRTYADQVVDLFSSDLLPYHFRDAHAHGRYAFDNGMRLAVTVYDGVDVWDADFAQARLADEHETRASDGRFELRWGNTVAGATLSGTFREDHGPLPGGSRWEQRVSQSRFSAFLDAGSGARTVESGLTDTRLHGALTAVSPEHALTVGYDVSMLRADNLDGTPAAGTRASTLPQRATVSAAYIDDIWRPSRGWTVQAGLRAEVLSSRPWRALSPRVSVKRLVTPDIAIVAAAGRMFQFSQSLVDEDGPIRLLDAWVVADEKLPPSSVWQWSSGIDTRFDGGRMLRVDGFYKRYDRLAEVNIMQDPLVPGDEFLAMRGTSYGADVLLRQDGTGRFNGWLAYTWSVSMRERDGRRWFPAHDRRHYLNLVGSWRFGRTVVGTRFGYASGLPHTEIAGQLPRRSWDPVRNVWASDGREDVLESLGARRNASRLPYTQRLDLSLSRVFERGRSTITPYLSVVNTYNAENVLFYIYDYGSDMPTRRAISQFPVLPTLGVTVAF